MSIIGAAVEKGLGMIGIKERVNTAAPLQKIDFSTKEASDLSLATIQQKEPAAEKVFILPYKVNSPDYFSFLQRLQNLGFDNLAMLNMPHGEKLSPIHNNIPWLRQQLDTPLKDKKPAGNFFKSGRFHLRMYQQDDSVAITAHIDSFPRKRNTESDYKGGEELFYKLLQTVKSTLSITAK